MRYIDMAKLKNRLPNDWENNALIILKDIRTLKADERAEAINKKAKETWGKLKSIMMDMSFKKCWYCETIEIRSDNAVDHYRPKNSVRDALNESGKPHDGYWWLAFEWENYRFSCTFCNSWRTTIEGTKGGKQDYFPLFEGSARAWKEGDDLRKEIPLLLDPTINVDTTLIAFTQEGKAVPAFSEEKNRLYYQKAEASIKYYHLYQHALEERRAAKYCEVRAKVKDAEDVYDKVRALSPLFSPELSKRIDELEKMMAADAEYSAVAYSALKALRKLSTDPDNSIPDMVFRIAAQ